MTRSSLARRLSIVGALVVLGCGGVSTVPDAGGGKGGGAAGAGGRGGTTGAAGQGGTGGAAGTTGGTGGSAGTGVAGGGGSAGTGGAGGNAGTTGTAGTGGGGATGGTGGATGGTGGAAGRGGTGGATGGTGGSAGTGGAAGRGGTGGTGGATAGTGGGGRGGTGGTGGATAGTGGATGGTGGATGGTGGGLAGTGGGVAGTGGGVAGTGGGVAGTGGSVAGTGGSAAGTGGSAAGTGGGSGTGGAAVAPIISSTNFLVVAHGLDLTITGTGFSGVTGLKIGNVAHTPNIASNTQMNVRVLDSTPTGAQSIVATSAAGQSLPFGVTIIHLVINELDPDTLNTDTMEFVELSTGVAAVPLTGYSLVFWNGATDSAYYAIDLDATTNSAGYLLAGNAALTTNLMFPDNTLQNGADAVGIYAAMASSFPTTSLVTATKLIDAVVYGSADPDATGLLDVLMGPVGSPARIQVDEGGVGVSDMRSIQRCGAIRLSGQQFGTGTPSPNAANSIICAAD